MLPKLKLLKIKLLTLVNLSSEADGFDTGFFVLHSEALNYVKNLSEKKFLVSK